MPIKTSKQFCSTGGPTSKRSTRASTIPRVYNSQRLPSTSGVELSTRVREFTSLSRFPLVPFQATAPAKIDSLKSISTLQHRSLYPFSPERKAKRVSRRSKSSSRRPFSPRAKRKSISTLRVDVPPPLSPASEAKEYLGRSGSSPDALKPPSEAKGTRRSGSTSRVPSSPRGEAKRVFRRSESSPTPPPAERSEKKYSRRPSRVPPSSSPPSEAKEYL